jgi:hypothetical protein
MKLTTLFLSFLISSLVCIGQNFGADSILSYYNFESTVDDQIGRNDGQLFGASYEEGVCGQSNSALLFDGKDDYLSFGDFDTFNQSLMRFGVSFWLKANHDTLNQAQSILGTINNGNSSTAVDLKIHSGSGNSFERNKLTFQMRDNNNKFVTLATKDDSLFNGKWHHVVVNVLDAKNGDGEIWIDNQKSTLSQGSNTGFSTYSRFDHDLVIGCKSNRGSRTSFYNGYIDNLLFSGVLSSAEIQTLYTSKKCDVLHSEMLTKSPEHVVYPNPLNTSYLSLDIPGQQESLVTVELYNNLGKEVGRWVIKNDEAIDMANIKSGLYYLQYSLSDNPFIYKLKLVVEK